MNARAVQPQAANDSRPERSVFFQTFEGARSEARRRARHESPSGTTTGVPFVKGVFTRYEPGGRVFEARVSDVDYEVREVPPAELARRVESGKREAVKQCISQAEELERMADGCRIASIAEHRRIEAKRLRSEARDIEATITVSEVA